MAEMTPQVSEVLEKALALSTQERGLLIDHLIESLDEGPAEEGVEQAWDEEIKRRVDEAARILDIASSLALYIAWVRTWSSWFWDQRPI